MYPFFPVSVRKSLFRLVLCWGLLFCPAGFFPCQAKAQAASGQLLAANDGSRDGGSGLSSPDEENAGDAPSVWEQVFVGSYVGGVLFGYPVHGPGLPDFLLLFAVGVPLLRSLRSRRQSSDGKKPRVTPGDLRGDYRLHRDSSPDARSVDSSGQEEEEDRDAGGKGWGRYLDPGSKQESEAMQQRARALWDSLRSSQPESPAPSGSGGGGPLPGTRPSSDSVARGVVVPADFDLEEFLDGARLLYSRLQTSWAARDLEDLKPFATAEMMDLLRRQAEQDPTPGSVEILLVTAVLTGLVRREEEERVDVAFSAILQENPKGRDQGEKISVNEIWHFVRGPATGGGWRLDGIEQAP
ncbi:MAG: 39S ribosomal protein L45 [Desulfovibrio sp.]|jgi:hypothetical protein|nr:39S ribosomal protein L45 [Desulfovibrio sp.]